MKIISLRNNQLDFFKGFDPFEILDRGDVKPTIKLGAVFEGENGDVPAGLLLGTQKGSELVIRWLFIAGSFRRRGFAERLISVMFQYAKKTGINQITAVIAGEYGRELVCGKGIDKEFFAGHGFVQLKEGYMVATVADYERMTAYKGPSLKDEGLALYNLFGDSTPEEYDALPDEEEGKKEPDEFPQVTHKNWEIKEVKLKNFAGLPALKNFTARHLNFEREEKVSYGRIGELSLMEFKHIIEICIDSHHTGFIENLAETPPDYFDTETSSFVKKDGKEVGLLLVHYEEQEKTIYAELLFVFCDDYLKALMGLLRFVITEAIAKYSIETRVILPYDEKLHRPLVNKLLENT
ncbi:MAG: GNAT family N-acetyltransferase [Lachnospiraceae bacterium]|nr:GNAT family N-acetyltransferase [Lachnospiraceae bacterium]